MDSDDAARRDRLNSSKKGAAPVVDATTVDEVAHVLVIQRAGAGIQARLLREGLIVRPLAGFGMPDHVRISVGLPEENELLVKALRRLLEGGK